MKKILILIIYTITVLVHPSKIYVTAKTPKYARAEIANVNLYKLSVEDNDINNILCLVEKTYFVEIISDNVDNYKVSYNGLTGYVKKNDVVLVQNIPTTPFPVNIQITVGNTCNLRSSPTTHPSTHNIITTINAGETNLKFLGRIFAEESIDFGGTTWFYVSYNGEKGYIYNKYIKNTTPIYPNNEATVLYSKTEFTQVNPLNEPNSIIIMILLFIPCVIILFILYLPRKTRIKSHKKKIKVIDRY